MLRHQYDEAIYRDFTKVAPKNIVFSKTHSFFDQLALIICIDSLGFEQCLEHLFLMVFSNDENKMNPVTRTWAYNQDSRSDYMKQQQQKKCEKIRHTAAKKIDW